MPLFGFFRLHDRHKFTVRKNEKTLKPDPSTYKIVLFLFILSNKRYIKKGNKMEKEYVSLRVDCVGVKMRKDLCLDLIGDCRCQM